MKLLTTSKNMIDNLDRIGIHSSFELVSYYPYRYDRFTYTDESIPFNDKQRVILLGRIVSNPKLVKTNRMDIVSFFFVSNQNNLYLVKAFNRPFLMSILNLQDYFSIVCSYSLERKELNLINFKKGEYKEDERIKSVYHLPNSLQASAFTNLIKRTFEKYNDIIPNVLPKRLYEKYRLLDHKDALYKVHFPKKEQDINEGFRTLKFEECFEYCFRNYLVREENRLLVKDDFIKIDKNKINEFILSLSYKLSIDQIAAIRDIILDMDKKSLMYRLLQGDVGTGKSIVGFVALYGNYLRGKQGALLAPTDSLARQHYENAKILFSPYSITVELLVGSMTHKEKQRVVERLKNGEIDIIIGTHAIFSLDVSYHSLGLAIIDEQHRFGVNQRNILVSKGDHVDLLLMSATPIPRTLSLSIYGDLDVSSLSVYPLGKREVKTLVVDYDSSKIESLIDYTLSMNRQVFMVCPKISNSFYSHNKSAEEIYEKYQPIYQKKIGLLHGKMNNNDRNSLLDKFKNNEVPILVCTTVVELGIDVKNAGAMIIFSANSFGLASLHQLRGRVGRNAEKAYCLLVDHFEEDEDDSRLLFLANCSDGFKISEEDLLRRGPGDFSGIEQSGFPSFKCLNIVSDFKMFEIARNETRYIMEHLEDEENMSFYKKMQEKMQNNEEIVHLFD